MSKYVTSVFTAVRENPMLGAVVVACVAYKADKFLKKREPTVEVVGMENVMNVLNAATDLREITRAMLVKNIDTSQNKSDMTIDLLVRATTSRKFTYRHIIMLLKYHHYGDSQSCEAVQDWIDSLNGCDLDGHEDEGSTQNAMKVALL